MPDIREQFDAGKDRTRAHVAGVVSDCHVGRICPERMDAILDEVNGEFLAILIAFYGRERSE